MKFSTIQMRYRHVVLAVGSLLCLPLSQAKSQSNSQNNAPAQSPALPTVAVSFQAKKMPMEEILRDLSARYNFNFVMCEAPLSPGADAEIASRSFSESLDAVCKPFDFRWSIGRDNVVLFECKYTKLTAMPPLTRGEVWAVLEDFRNIASPFRAVQGDDIELVERHLTNSLTLDQWQTLRARYANRNGLAFEELTPEQQHDLIAYVTSQEFDFFVTDPQRLTYLQSLKADGSALEVLVIPPGEKNSRGRIRDVACIETRFRYRGAEMQGISCASNHPDFTTNAVILPSYQNDSAKIAVPTNIDHVPSLEASRVHLFAVNASLRSITTKLAEQTGQKVQTDDAIADARVSLRLDNVALPTALDALAKPHDWRFFKQEDGSWKVARKRPGAVINVMGTIAAMSQALPPAVRRYMQMDTIPQDLSPGMQEMLQRNGRWNWKLETATSSALRRLYASDLNQYRKTSQLTWNDLPRGAQTDLLSYVLYNTLKEARPLSKGMPGYVATPGADIIMFGNSRMDLLNLEVRGRNMNGTFNSGISLNNKLSEEKLTALRAAGILKDKEPKINNGVP